jgi:hypothetical protein
LSTTFDHTSLTFCNWDDPTKCTGDIGSTLWVTTGEVPSNALNSSRTFKFTANTPGIPLALVQISSRPFGAAFQLDDPYLVHSYAVQTEQGSWGISGEFTENFSYLQQSGGSANTDNFILNHSIWPAAQPSPFDQNIIKMMNTNGVGFHLLEGIPDPVYYIRVVPWDVNKPVGGLSNTVVLTYKARQEPPPITINTVSSPSYDLEITAYSPEQKVSQASFGCVIITAIDEAKLRASLENSIPWGHLGNMMGNVINGFIDSYKNKMANGDALCPAPLPEETTWDVVVGALGEFWDSVIQAFNAIKNGLVSAIADGINALFDEDICGKDCKTGLMTALNYSIAYFTGIPPTLPTFKDLVNNGIDYTVSLAVSEAGISCDADCAAKIRAGVQTVADAVTSAQSQPGCSGMANFYGKQPLCLPDGLTTQPVPGSVYTPGIATIQATRNGKGYQWSPDSNYSVLITSTARNEAIVGKSYYFYGPSWPGNPAGNMTFPFTFPEPMEGSLYEPASVILPDTLETGFKLVIPVTLTSTAASAAGKGYTYPPLLAYVLDQAKIMGMPDNSMQDLFGSVQHNSNYYLSQPGYSITIQAVLLCYDNSARKKIPCSNPVTRTFSAEEVQALIDQMNEVQP